MRERRTNRRARLAGVLLMAGLFALAPSARAQDVHRYLVDTGPLRIRDQFLLGMGFLGFDPVTADIVEQGKWQFDLIATVTNTFALSGSLQTTLEERDARQALTLEGLRELQAAEPRGGIFLVDGELYRTAIAVRRGISERFQLELVLPVLSFQGGVLDSLVEGFHDVFGFSQVGRTGVPRDQFTIFVGSNGHEYFIDQDPGVALGDLTVGGKLALLKSNAQRSYDLSLEVVVKLPTGEEEPLFSSGETDFGTQLLATRYYRRTCIHASVGVLYLGESEVLGTEAQVLPTGMLAWERAIGSKTSGVVQLTASESPFRSLDLDELSEVSLQATLGLKRVVQSNWVLFFGLTENFANFNVSPDVGFHVGLTRVFE